MRFDEKTRMLNALSFAAMPIFSSGVCMFAMGTLLDLLLGWDVDPSVLVSAGIVLAYVLLVGLASAIYNEVLPFFMVIVLGFLPLVWIGLREVGGWGGDGGEAFLASGHPDSPATGHLKHLRLG